MARSLCPDRERATIAVGAAILALAVPSAAGQIGAIAAGGLDRLGAAARRAAPQAAAPLAMQSAARLVGRLRRSLFFALLIGLPLLRRGACRGSALALFDAFYRSGALVFGGGHVVLPLLQAEVVPPGWVSNDAFLAGYGAAQAVPGPLFTFAPISAR